MINVKKKEIDEEIKYFDYIGETKLPKTVFFFLSDHFVSKKENHRLSKE